MTTGKERIREMTMGEEKVLQWRRQQRVNKRPILRTSVLIWWRIAAFLGLQHKMGKTG